MILFSCSCTDLVHYFPLFHYYPFIDVCISINQKVNKRVIVNQILSLFLSPSVFLLISENSNMCFMFRSFSFWYPLETLSPTFTPHTLLFFCCHKMLHSTIFAALNIQSCPPFFLLYIIGTIGNNIHKGKNNILFFGSNRIGRNGTERTDFFLFGMGGLCSNRHCPMSVLSSPTTTKMVSMLSVWLTHTHTHTHTHLHSLNINLGEWCNQESKRQYIRSVIPLL